MVDHPLPEDLAGDEVNDEEVIEPNILATEEIQNDVQNKFRRFSTMKPDMIGLKKIELIHFDVNDLGDDSPSKTGKNTEKDEMEFA